VKQTKGIVCTLSSRRQIAACVQQLRTLHKGSPFSRRKPDEQRSSQGRAQRLRDRSGTVAAADQLTPLRNGCELWWQASLEDCSSTNSPISLVGPKLVPDDTRRDIRRKAKQ